MLLYVREPGTSVALDGDIIVVASVKHGEDGIKIRSFIDGRIDASYSHQSMEKALTTIHGTLAGEDPFTRCSEASASHPNPDKSAHETQNQSDSGHGS